MTNATINVKANQFQAMLHADGMTGLDGQLTTLSLRSKDGRMSLLVPPQMFPFIAKGDVVFVSMTVVKPQLEIEQEPSSSLIMPGKQG